MDEWLTTNTDFDNHSCRIFARLAGNTTAEQATARIKDICTPFVKHSIETYTVFSLSKILYLHYDEANGGIGEGRIGFRPAHRDHRRLRPFARLHQLYEPVTGRMRTTRKRSSIRKTLGSLREQLIGQFLGESILVALLAFVLAVGLTALSLPWFSSLSASP